MREAATGQFEFAGFRFDREGGLLWREGEPVPLSPKTAELLALLLESEGRFVSKEEIFDRIWPDTFVEEGVLTQNIYVLRKALRLNGNGIIENRTRLGYRITVPVARAPVMTIPEPFPDSALTMPVKRKWVAAAILAALVTISGIAAYLLLSREIESEQGPAQNLGLRRLTDTGNITFSTISPDGTRAILVRSDGIYLRDLLALTENKLAVTNVERFGSARFSSNGDFIFLRNRANTLIPADVFRVSAAGGEAERVASNVWSLFTVSPDDRRIFFARVVPNENRHVLVAKDLANGAETELMSVAAPEEIRLRAYPAISPDGNRLAVVIDNRNQGFSRLAIVDIEAGTIRDLRPDRFNQVEQAAWHPSRAAILMSARESKNFQIWELAERDGKLTRITNDLNNYLALTISADGKKIVAIQHSFYTNLWLRNDSAPENERQLTLGVVNRDGSSGIDFLPDGGVVYTSNEGESGAVDLWRLDPASGERRQLTRDAGSRNENPSVSRDGTSIYFISNRTGRNAVWRIGANGENPAQVTFADGASDTHPQVSPDGRFLYLLRSNEGRSLIVRRSLESGSEEVLALPVTISPASYLSLSPDGRYLAFHNLTDEVRSADAKQLFQVGVAETARPESVLVYNIGGRIPRIFWNSDGSFEFVAPRPGKDEVMRQSVSEPAAPLAVRSFSAQEVYFLASRMNGESLVSRGRQMNDAVLLTEPE